MSIELGLIISVFIIFFFPVISSFARYWTRYFIFLIEPFYLPLLNFSSSVLTCGNLFAQTLSGYDVDIATSSLVALLADSDSYVYLSALTALSRLADVPLMRGRVFKDLLHAFSCKPKGQSMTPERRSIHSAETNQCDEEFNEGYSVCVSTRHRALIGEALGIILRRAGDAAPPLVPSLVAVCVRVARTRLSKEEEESLEGFADLRTTILIRPVKDDKTITPTAVKDDNGSRPASNMNDKKEEGEGVENAQEEQRHQAATAAAATAGDSVFLRQSALSLLADAVVCSGWGASKYLVDIVDIATGVLAMEGIKFSTQASSSARRYLPVHQHDTICSIDMLSLPLVLFLSCTICFSVSLLHGMLFLCSTNDLSPFIPQNSSLIFFIVFLNFYYSYRVIRSAAFLLRHLISGLREKLVTIKDGGLHLKAAYRSLKSSVTTDDPVIVHHCQAALGALDEMMREQLFLSESQLRGSELPKIGIFKKPVG